MNFNVNPWTLVGHLIFLCPMIASAQPSRLPIEITPLTATRPDYGGKAYNPGAMPDLAIQFKGTDARFSVGDGEANRQPHAYRKGGVSDQIIKLGYSPTVAASGIRDFKFDPEGDVVVWTETDFILKDSEQWAGAKLDIEAAYYHTEVFIDGQYVGEHTGGYDAFSFDVSRHLSGGVRVGGGTRHTLSFRNRSTPSSRTQISGKQERSPGEGSIFYKTMIGIYKDVQLARIHPAGYIAQLQAVGNIDGVLQVEAAVNGSLSSQAMVSIKVIDRSSRKTVGQGIASVTQNSAVVTVKLKEVKLWDPENPVLYDYEAYLDVQGKTLDHLRSYTLFKDFKKDSHLFLNRKLLTLNGQLKQLYWKNTGYTAGPGVFERDIRNMVQVGFNAIRSHQNVPTYTELETLAAGVNYRDLETGEMKKRGMLTSIEIPSLRDFTAPEVLQQFLAETRSIIGSKGSHPTVIMGIGYNETWGALDDHGVKASLAFQIMVQKKIRETILGSLPQFGLKKSPIQMLVPFNDGWEQASAYLEGGAVDPDVDPSTTYVAVHDYFSADVPVWKYAQVSKEKMALGSHFPDPNPHKRVFLPGYTYGGKREVSILTEWEGTSGFNPDYPKSLFGYNRVPITIEDWRSVVNDQYRSFIKYMEIYGWNNFRTQDIDTDQEGNGAWDADGKPKWDLHTIRQFNQLIERTAAAHFQKFMLSNADISCDLIMNGTWDGSMQPYIQP